MSNATEIASDNSGGDEQTATVAVGALIIVLAIITVVLRFYTRITTRVGLGWDDWLILVAVVFTLLTAVLLVWGNSIDPTGAIASVNTDPNYVYTPEDVLYTKLSYISSVLYFTIAGSTKLGILLMYRRIFNVDRVFRQQLFVACTLVIGWWIGCTVATLTDCIPLEYTWINALDDPRYCFNFNIFWMASGVCEVLIDVVILALPIRAVYSLQLSRKKKATVACIFLLGGFVVITGLVKVVLGYVPGEREPSFSRTEVWTTVHTSVAIICASLPIYKPLVTRVARSSLVSKLAVFSPRYRQYGSSGWSASDRSGSQRLHVATEEDTDFNSNIELRRIVSR
ncbi:hypothetical protein MMC10_001782 [Thelotrema lepadinum]|nr:hypothetical protein [Thelotrema lepadinum]